MILCEKNWVGDLLLYMLNKANFKIRKFILSSLRFLCMSFFVSMSRSASLLMNE